MPSIFDDRRAVRRHFRTIRHQLAPAVRRTADQALCEAIGQLMIEHQAQTVGFFFPHDGEPNILSATHYAPTDTQFALPILHPFCEGNLLFLRSDLENELQSNRYGIPEPVLNVQRVIPLSAIDILLVPLVAFDSRGNRLGMGGGFYDRTLAAWSKGRLPSLLPIGIAYSEQRAEALPYAAWDVPLPMILTPDKLWRFSHKNV